MSTGPRTEAGKAAVRKANRKHMIERWQRMKAQGITSMPMSEEARERTRQASRKRMRMMNRRRQAREWADWIIGQLEQRASWPLDRNSHAVVLEPFRRAVDHGGFQELLELASFTKLKIELFHKDGADIYGIVLDRYRYNARRLAEEFRAGAER